MAEEFLCPKCRQPVKKEATFCGNCGFQLIQATTATATAPIAAAPTPAPQVAPAAAPVSLAVSSNEVSDSVHSIPGVKVAAWASIIIGLLESIYPFWMLIAPDSYYRFAEMEVQPDGERILVVIIAFAIVAPMIITGIIMLRTHNHKRARHWLIVLAVLTLILILTELTNIPSLIMMSTLLALVIRAFINIRKYEKSPLPVAAPVAAPPQPTQPASPPPPPPPPQIPTQNP